MKIVFLNAWHGKVGEPLENFLREQATTTDIFCFQEADDRLEEICASVLCEHYLEKSYKFTAVHEYYPQKTYIKKDIKLLKTDSILMDTPNVGLGLYTKVQREDNVLHLCNVHGMSQPGDKKDTAERITQSEGLIGYFEKINEPTVIGGDFNLTPDTKSIEVFAQAGYRDLIKEFKITNTRNNLAWARFPDNKQYFSDYVFTSKDVSVANFEVPYNEISDHLPLILEVC